MSAPAVTVLGAGLAGCEAAYQCAQRGVAVRLVEMKPKRFTPAHHSADFAELCCSNSLRSDALSNAVGLLKEEMRRVGSLIMEAADATRVPAGSALAVDRERFAQHVTAWVKNHPLIKVVEAEATEIPEESFEVQACGFGCVLAPTKAFKDVQDQFNNMFAPIYGTGEDLSFCWRARKCGYKIVCDPRIVLGHYGHTIIDRNYWEDYIDFLVKQGEKADG